MLKGLLFIFFLGVLVTLVITFVLSTIQENKVEIVDGKPIHINPEVTQFLNNNYLPFELESMWCLEGEIRNESILIDKISPIIGEVNRTPNSVTINSLKCDKKTIGMIHTHSPARYKFENKCRFSVTDYFTYGRIHQFFQVRESIFGVQCGIDQFAFIDQDHLIGTLPFE